MMREKHICLKCLTVRVQGLDVGGLPYCGYINPSRRWCWHHWHDLGHGATRGAVAVVSKRAFSDKKWNILDHAIFWSAVAGVIAAIIINVTGAGSWHC